MRSGKSSFHTVRVGHVARQRDHLSAASAKSRRGLIKSRSTAGAYRQFAACSGKLIHDGKAYALAPTSNECSPFRKAQIHYSGFQMTIE
jgi:hypothetical protein